MFLKMYYYGQFGHQWIYVAYIGKSRADVYYRLYTHIHMAVIYAQYARI